MRLRATPKALALRLDGGETPEDVRRLSLPEGLPLEVEVAGPVAQETLEALLALGRPLTLVPPRGRVVEGTLVVPRGLRAGQRVEYPGTVVVLGDVNPGAEVVAGGDVIVVGRLMGLAHAGASGDEERFIFALELRAKQVRIGPHLAQAPEEAEEGLGPEVVRAPRAGSWWSPGGGSPFPSPGRDAPRSPRGRRSSLRASASGRVREGPSPALAQAGTGWVRRRSLPAPRRSA